VSGRVSRQELWLGYSFALAVVILLEHHLTELSLALRRPWSGWWERQDLELAVALPKVVIVGVVVWPMVALAVKRVHDLNLSGWWFLALPMVSAAAIAAGVPYGGMLYWLGIVMLGLVPGMRGDGRYGADPLVGRR
jgi:uncharacterized membrane protein YhaH (DUF805 family)